MEAMISLDLSARHRRILVDVMEYARETVWQVDSTVHDQFQAIANRLEPPPWSMARKVVHVTAFEAALMLAMMGRLLDDTKVVPEGEELREQLSDIFSELLPAFLRGFDSLDLPEQPPFNDN